MTADELSTNAASEKAAEARRLAERGLHEQAVGNTDEADRLLAQGQEIDPDAVADVLREHDAGRAPDARLQDLADQDVERVLPRITPGPIDATAAPQCETTSRRAVRARAGTRRNDR